jgi:hypothetical protein
MPLEKGNAWVYDVRIDATPSVVNLKVDGEAPVGDVSGWLLTSEMGNSRMAWEGDQLIAAELAGTTYWPPIPILAPNETKWEGVVGTPTTKQAGKAVVSRSAEELKVGGRAFKTVKCVVDMTVGEETIQLTTWFFPDRGIMRQEQRSGPGLTRDRFLECVSGP